jgi:hypothetical protein
VAWTSYRPAKGLEEDMADLKAHGIGLISARARTAEQVRDALAIAREHGMKYHIGLPEITENARLVEAEGLKPEWAVLIGGAYKGLAIDRHVFSFSAGPHEIVIEPPVYHAALPYSGSNGERSGHYLPEMPDPVKAEIVVPLAPFDGRQHLKILPATIELCEPGVKPENDSAAGLADVPEIQQRRLWRVKFDLTGLEGAMLEKVGIAVYWPFHGSRTFVMAGRGDVSARAESTREAMRRVTRKELAVWSEANGGKFPIDTVIAARFGDETFYVTGHVTTSPAVSYPLWDYSQVAIDTFRSRCGGGLEYPRTWGYPEIYGSKAYGWWMHLMHEACAQLCGVIRNEIAHDAPGLLLFRNTTRLGVFELPNDRDGSGQELLTANLDIVHLDPYPVSGDQYRPVIPRDMSYCGGLARRYGKPLVPWMQAHSYAPGNLTDVSPEQVRRMTEEQWAQGVDAVMWLGYGSSYTFPNRRPESWEVAGAFHHRLQAQRPPKPHTRLAVLRPYDTWAISHLVGGHGTRQFVRNPGDWMLQQFLEVYAVQHGDAYDVFELPPDMDASARARLERELASYDFVVSTESCGNAWVIGKGLEGQEIDSRTAREVQAEFEGQLRSRGWIQ